MNATNLNINRIDEETLSSLDQYTFPQILLRQAERLGSDKIAIREKAYGIWQTYDWREYFRYTKFVALGLISLGLKRGENVGLILDNHPEWLFSELGIQSLGAVTVPFSPQQWQKSRPLGLNVSRQLTSLPRIRNRLTRSCLAGMNSHMSEDSFMWIPPA